MTAQTAVVESHLDAWKQRDPKAIVAHFAPRGGRRFAFVVLPGPDEPTQRDGAAEIVKQIRAMITAPPDRSLDMLGRVACSDRTATGRCTICVATGTPTDQRSPTTVRVP
jgi:hypothetical protein